MKYNTVTGLELKPGDIDKLQLRKCLWVNMKNVVGLNHLTAEICGIRSVIMLRLEVELGFEHTLEEVDKLHHLVSVSGRAPCCDKGAT